MRIFNKKISNPKSQRLPRGNYLQPTLETNKGLPNSFGGLIPKEPKISKSRKRSTFKGTMISLFQRGVAVFLLVALLVISLRLHSNLFISSVDGFIATHSNGIDVGIGGKPKKF